MVKGKLDSDCKCFRCGCKMDGFTHLDPDARPQNLDIGVCVYCSAVLQYKIDDMTNPPHITTIEASADVVADNMASISRIQRLIKEFRERQT